MKIKTMNEVPVILLNKTLVFVIIAIAIIFTISNVVLLLEIKGFEMRLNQVEQIIDEYDENTENIKYLIRQTNPALKKSRVAEIAKAISASARTNGLNRFLLASIANVESSFRPDAISPANARGLFQVLPGTFKEVHTGDVDNWRDNIEAGARYLKKLIRRFGNVRLSLAAYNCGPSRTPERILAISGGYADQVLAGWHRLNTAGGDGIDRMGPWLLASSRR